MSAARSREHGRPGGPGRSRSRARGTAAPAATHSGGRRVPPAEPSRKQPGLASRSWVPVALSFGTVIIVAIALVIYFSQHS